MKPSSLSRYVATFRQILDFAGIKPNPGRDRRVKLPRIDTPIVEPPSAEHPGLHSHDLRHRYASIKLREGVPVTELAAQLGHSKKSLTLDIYSHVLLES